MNLAFINLQNISFSGSWDWLSALVFLAVALAYGLFMGRNRLVAMMLGAYFSFLLTRAIPWKELSWLGLKAAPVSTTQIFIFLALVLGFYFAIPHSSLRHTMRLGGKGSGAWWQILILSVLQIGLILSMIIAFLPAKVTAGLSPLAQIIFVGPWPYFMWLLAPILAIMFLRGRQSQYSYEE
ncbi:MAG: hypothetical protein PHT44_03700 [Candidatus Portnoybacteria bacterium]|nr:hypothetical protein [Candidatus Portnoybacteria bacterium]MDD4983069.1 hypothetical protein [Candidatus Portnoybacteria bacterium]